MQGMDNIEKIIPRKVQLCGSLKIPGISRRNFDYMKLFRRDLHETQEKKKV